MIRLTHLQDNPCHGLEDSSEAARVFPWGTSLFTATRYPSLPDHHSLQQVEHPVSPSFHTTVHLTCYTRTLDCGNGRVAPIHKFTLPPSLPLLTRGN